MPAIGHAGLAVPAEHLAPRQHRPARSRDRRPRLRSPGQTRDPGRQTGHRFTRRRRPRRIQRAVRRAHPRARGRPRPAGNRRHHLTASQSGVQRAPDRRPPRVDLSRQRHPRACRPGPARGCALPGPDHETRKKPFGSSHSGQAGHRRTLTPSSRELRQQCFSLAVVK